MKIGLDFDGVITKNAELKSYIAKELFGVDFPPDQFKKEIVVENGFITLEQYYYIQNQAYENLDFALKIGIIPGAVEYINKFKEDGHDLCIITARKDKSEITARKIMKESNIELDIIGIGQGVTKDTACKERGIEVYIDDYLSRLTPLIVIVPHLFLFNQGYNQKIKLPQEIKRVSSWSEFYEKVNSLQEKLD